MLKGYLFVGLFITAGCMLKCYHQRCRTNEYDWTICDQELYQCIEWKRDGIFVRVGKCKHIGKPSWDGYVSCPESQKCHWADMHGNGQASCVDREDWDPSLSTVAIIIIAASCCVVGLAFISCCCCFYFKKCCFKNRSRSQERANTTQPVTFSNQSKEEVQATSQPRPATQDPPPQYPPEYNAPPPTYDAAVRFTENP